ALDAVDAASGPRGPGARRIRAGHHAPLRPLRRPVTIVALAVVTVSSVFLFVYGANLVFISLRALKLPRPSPKQQLAPGPLPLVAVQLPVYNERYVAERAIDAAARLDWPSDRLQVQVLDDSDDDTPGIVARTAGRWRALGVDVRHLRRSSR